jgi:hypothetical protein
MHTRNVKRRTPSSPVEPAADPGSISIRNVRIKLGTLATVAVTSAISGAATPITLVLAITCMAVPLAVAGHGGTRQVRALFFLPPNSTPPQHN